MDFVIGYGSFDDVAGTFAPEIRKILERLTKEKRSIFFVASVTGTHGDPNPYGQQREMLEDAGVYVMNSNASAVEFALSIIGQLEQPLADNEKSRPRNSIWDKPRVANVGIKHFTAPIQQHGGKALQFQWNPPAGGDPALVTLLDKLYSISCNYSCPHAIFAHLGT
jgi:FdrA protein